MAVRPPGFGHARQDERSRARDLLLDSALRLFVEQGYVGVRVEDIAKAAGVSRATFYKHFAEREEILAELFARLLGREPIPSPPGAAADALDRIRRLLADTAAQMLRHEQLARFVYTLPIRHAVLLSGGSTPPVLDTLARLIREGAAAGVVRADVPPEIIAAHVAYAFEAAMRDWAEGRVSDPAPRLRMLLELAFHGVAASETA